MVATRIQTGTAHPGKEEVLGTAHFWPFSKDLELMKEREHDFSLKPIVIEQGVTVKL